MKWLRYISFFVHKSIFYFANQNLKEGKTCIKSCDVADCSFRRSLDDIQTLNMSYKLKLWKLQRRNEMSFVRWNNTQNLFRMKILQYNWYLRILKIKIAKFPTLDRNRQYKTFEEWILQVFYLLQLSSIMRQEVIPIIFCFDMSICICINNNTSIQRISIVFLFQFAKEIVKVKSLDTISKSNK